MDKIEKFICLLGLPRSGTTIATTILDTHSSVELFYEPWNSSKNSPPPIYENPQQFKKKMREKYAARPNPEATAIGFKETSTHYEALEWSEATLAAMEKHCPCQLLIIVRDPMHTYLSRVEGLKKYWDHPEAEVTEKGFQNFIRQAIGDYKFMNRLSNNYDTIIFHYDALVATPEYVVTRIMEFVGLPYESSQLNYYNKNLQRKKIMGDPSFMVKCQNGIGISQDSIILRQKESEEFKKNLKSDFWKSPEIKAFDAWIQNIKQLRIIGNPEFF